MLDILLTVLFLWLLLKAVRLALRVAWGTTKIIASLLFALACPALFVCLVFAGGIALLLPIALVGIALWLLAECT